jgi:archaellum component FlaC
MDIDNNQINKNILENKKEISSLQKEYKDIKKLLKNIERKINLISDKIQEFEIVFDAAEIIEEEIERQMGDYNTEWSPYDDEDFEPEQYEDYDAGDDDTHGF